MLDLDPIKLRLTAATPGPYEWDGEGGMITHDITCGAAKRPVLWVHKYGGVGAEFEDQKMIERAPADITALVAEVEQLRDLLKVARRAGGPWSYDFYEQMVQALGDAKELIDEDDDDDDERPKYD